jgi:outer membrane protein OmpA-like peptidoglycan-associated protein
MGPFHRAAAGVGFAAVAVLVAGSVVACGSSGGDSAKLSCPDAAVAGLAVALGGRANSPAPVLPSSLGAMIDKVMDDRKGVTAIRVDGEPKIVCGLRFTANPKATEAKKEERKKFRRLVGTVLNRTHAVRPEADPLRALSYAANAAQPGGTVMLVDSGLQTVPPLDFRANDLLYADPDAVVRDLKRRGLLPDLRERVVVLAGIGYVADPQADLDDATRQRLVTMWERLVRAGGATDVKVLTEPVTKESAVKQPTVSPVTIRVVENAKPGCGQEIILPDDGAVGFVPNTATIKDPARARALLGQVATWMAENGHATVALVGTVAHYGPDQGNGGLSRARAQRVAELLRELGVPGNRVSARGDGWGPFPSKDAPPDPTYDQQNRRVVLRFSCA